MNFIRKLRKLNVKSQKFVIIYSAMEFLYLFNFFWLIQNVYFLEVVSEAQLTTLFIIWSLGVLIFEIPSGFLADKFGRKFIVVIGRLLWLLGVIIFFNIDGFKDIALGLVIWGIGEAFVSGANEALLFDTLKCYGDEETYGEIQSFVFSLQQVGLAIGVVTAGFITDVSIQYTLIGSIIIAFLTFLASLFLKDPPAIRKPEEIRFINHLDQSFKDIMSSSLLVKIALFNILVLSAYYNLSEFFIVSLNKLGFSWSGNGVLAFVEMLFFILGTAIFNKVLLGKKFRYRYIILGLLFTLCFYAVSLSLITPVLIGFLSLRALKAIGELQTGYDIQNNIDSNNRATIISTISFGINIGSIIFSFVQGQLLNGMDLFSSFRVFVLSAMIFTLLYFSRRIFDDNKVV